MSMGETFRSRVAYFRPAALLLSDGMPTSTFVDPPVKDYDPVSGQSSFAAALYNSRLQYVSRRREGRKMLPIYLSLCVLIIPKYTGEFDIRPLELLQRPFVGMKPNLLPVGFSQWNCPSWLHHWIRRLIQYSSSGHGDTPLRRWRSFMVPLHSYLYLVICLSRWHEGSMCMSFCSWNRISFINWYPIHEKRKAL